MRVFYDLRGREWHVRLDARAIQRCRTAGIDVLATRRGEFPAEFFYGRVEDFLVMLWAIVEPQAIAQGIDADGFFYGLQDPTNPLRNGRAVEPAAAAVFAEI